MGTRTLMTTPLGELPEDDARLQERWARGPQLPVEPGPPGRFHGVVGMLVTMLLVVGLTLLVAPAVLDPPQDPTFGGGADTSDA